MATLSPETPRNNTAAAATPSPQPPPRRENLFWCSPCSDDEEDWQFDDLAGNIKKGSKRNTPYTMYINKNKLGLDDFDIYNEFCKYNHMLSTRGYCVDNTKGSLVKLTCDCLGMLKEGPGGSYYEAIAEWQIEQCSIPRNQRQQALVWRIHNASLWKDYVPKHVKEDSHLLMNSPKIYEIPCHHPQDWIDMDAEEARGHPHDRLRNHKVCKHALMDLIGFGKDAFSACVKHLQMGTSPRHKAQGKPPNNKRKWDQEYKLLLKRHFIRLIYDESTVAATRVVREKNGRNTLRDNNDNTRYLSPHLSKRKCYERFCYSIGWKIKTDNRGAVVSKEAIESPERRDNIPSWTAYRCFWAKHYPQLKVSKPSADICGQCYRFHQAYKYKASRRNNIDDDTDNLFCPDENLPMVNTLTGDNVPMVNEVANPQALDSSTGKHVHIKVEPDPEMIRVEALIKEAAEHVDMAGVQRLLVNQKIEQARSDAVNKVHHSDRTFTFICDYSQNMQLPHFGEHQPGETYYWSPLNVYVFGVVDVAHLSEEGIVDDHLYAHHYLEGQSKKGGNSVGSLLLKTLKNLSVMEKGRRGKELNVVFDNCGGQNKNNHVLLLVPYLVEMGYFERVNFIFLIVGHTKNSADRLFNLLKANYRKENVATPEELHELCDRSPYVTPLPLQDGDILDFDIFFQGIYNRYDAVMNQHLFTSTIQPDGSVYTFTRRSALDCHVEEPQTLVKEGMQDRPRVMATTEASIVPMGEVPRHRRCNLYTRYRQFVDHKHWDHWLYVKPSDELLQEEKEDQRDRRQVKVAAKKRKTKGKGGQSEK